LSGFIDIPKEGASPTIKPYAKAFVQLSFDKLASSYAPEIPKAFTFVSKLELRFSGLTTLEHFVELKYLEELDVRYAKLGLRFYLCELTSLAVIVVGIKYLDCLFYWRIGSICKALI